MIQEKDSKTEKGSDLVNQIINHRLTCMYIPSLVAFFAYEAKQSPIYKSL